MSFFTNWLQWPFQRASREFRIYVVEPLNYIPAGHGNIFDAVLRNFFYPVPEHAVMEEISFVTPTPVEADLIVFPEGFLSSEDLVKAMIGFVDNNFQSCMHIGLRPNSSTSNHLFSHQDIQFLLNEISKVSSICKDDLNSFTSWFEKQKKISRFNLGCMFLVDSDGRLRVCLHPKSVRAGVEYSTLSDEHMTEANLLSLVTLTPPNTRYMSVTIQPLICADALTLPGDTMAPNPLKAFSDSAADHFPKLLADHIDIVSLSLATPVTSSKNSPEKKRRWRREFEAAYLSAAKGPDFFRHHFATFAMANYGSLNGEEAGLSGAFVPVPFQFTPYPQNVTIWSQGKNAGDVDEKWICAPRLGMENNGIERNATSHCSRVHLVCLDVSIEHKIPIARALGYTLSRLVRDNPIGGKFPGLTRLDVRSVCDTSTAES